MSKEKQIEEMAKLVAFQRGYGCNEQDHCDMSCQVCKVGCIPHEDAQILYEGGYRKMPDNIGDFSDGYHTFNELYHHRAVLFSVICNMFPERAWKSKLHDTGDMYDGMFIVGIETEQGQATYHYDIDPYWDMFKVKELEKAPKYDGHTPSDAIERIGNLPCSGCRKQIKGEWSRFEVDSSKGYGQVYYQHKDCNLNATQLFPSPYHFCPNCGAKMKGGAE